MIRNGGRQRGDRQKIEIRKSIFRDIKNRQRTKISSGLFLLNKEWHLLGQNVFH